MIPASFNILIVDDNAHNLFTLRTLLQGLGEQCKVREAMSGEQALMAVLEDDVHLILLDVQMPVMDGYETARHLQMASRTRHIPIVFVTAVFKAEEFRQRGYRVGAVDYLTKPIDDNLLLNRVRLYQRLFWREQKLRDTIAALEDAQGDLQLAARVFDTMSDGVLILTVRESIVTVNPAFTRATGYSKEEAVGQKAGMLKSGRHDEAFFDAMRAQLLEQGQWQGEIWNRRKSGDIYPEWLNVSVIRDAGGAIQYYVCIFSDLTSQEQIREHLRHLAYHDVLTDLPNRELFQDRLLNAMAAARRERRKVGLMFIDLDRFKNINDTLGHRIGDLLLQVVAQRISGCLRANDTVARIGGDEFTVILAPFRQEDLVVTVAAKLIQALSPPIEIEGNTLYITASIGIGIYPDDGADADVLLRNADAAMYRAKEKGRNNFQFYSAELTSQAFEHLQLENDLRLALAEDQLVLYYQPLVDLASGGTIGVEALVRWNHPQRGLLTPDCFLPVAEDSGLIGAIDQWVMTAACRQFREWRDAGYRLQRIAVNIAGKDIQGDSLSQQTGRVLQECGICPDQLELEVSEGFIMGDDGQDIDVLDKLRAMGVMLAIDDFGTGYSSLAYLKRLPVSRLKIDRSFVRDLPEDKDDAAIVRAIIALGRSLQLELIAEGVETEEQRSLLRQEGCSEGQGYLFSKPLPADELQRLWPNPVF